jgi:hypothetical protein
MKVSAGIEKKITFLNPLKNTENKKCANAYKIFISII